LRRLAVCVVAARRVVWYPRGTTYYARCVFCCCVRTSFKH